MQAQVRRERAVVLGRVVELMQQGVLRPPNIERVPLRDYALALDKQHTGYQPGKTLFKLQA